MLDHAPEQASTEHKTETGTRRTAARTVGAAEQDGAWVTPSGDPRERHDLLAGQLRRAVARRARAPAAQLARMLTPVAGMTNNDHIDKTLERHSDGKRFRVDKFVTDAQRMITAFKIISYDESLEVSVSNVEFGWFGDKESKKAWDSLQAASNPAPVPQVVPAVAVQTVKSEDTLTAYVNFPAGTTVPGLVEDRDIALPEGAPPITDCTTKWRLATSKIKYSQNTVSPTFSKATPSGAGTLTAAIAALKSGAKGKKTGKADTLESMKAVPLRLVLTHWGAVVSLDNRRLYVVKQANKGRPWVRWASAQELAEAKSHFTSKNKGASVVVT